MLVRELQYNERDNVEMILNRQFIRDLQSLKSDFKSTKANVNSLRDDIDFSDTMPKWEVLKPDHLNPAMLQKWGNQIFALDKAKKKKQPSQKTADSTNYSKKSVLFGKDPKK